jgi:phage shock protein PspC (stress-responsive transcriptional regulator)
MAMAGLVRPRRGRWIAGVCAALAKRFDTSPLLVRAIFVVSTIIPGPQFLIYILLWILIPSQNDD